MQRRASGHVVNHLSFLNFVERTPPIKIELADGSVVEATQCDMLSVNVRNNMPMACNPYMMPSLKLNIPSYSRLDDNIMTTTFKKRKCLLAYGQHNGVIFESVKKG